jgi:hypothetical protein
MSALKPINFTTFEWFEDHSGYSIFKSALEATGLQEALSINIKDETSESSGLTLLIEPDAVYNKRNILTFEDLVAQISPANSDYTNTLNPLYTYTAYHILTDNLFLVDFEDDATNYSTYSDIPVLIDGLGLDIAINKGKEIFDTIVSGPDTTFIDFVGFDYDASNVITQSGALHVIDQILKPKQPSRANKNYEFFEEPLLWEYRLEAGEYLIDDTSSMRRLKWTGADLIFVIKGSPDEINAWNEDYLYINGDFTITYTIPKLVQGRYTVYLGAELYTRDNAVVEVSIDGKNLGGLVNLATGGSSNYPFNRKELGTVDFVKFEEHVIKIQSLIPGSFYWDYIRFEPN